MVSFLKTCLRGFLTVILSPFWVLLFLLYFVYGIVLFIYTGIKSLINMIMHKDHGIYDTIYDKKAQEILSNPNLSQPYYPQQMPVQQPIYQNYQQPYNPMPGQMYPPYPPYQQQYPYVNNQPNVNPQSSFDQNNEGGEGK